MVPIFGPPCVFVRRFSPLQPYCLPPGVALPAHCVDVTNMSAYFNIFPAVKIHRRIAAPAKKDYRLVMVYYV